MLSRNTARRYAQHRSGTHNARTTAENTADVHALPNGSGDEGRTDALGVTASELQSCQRSSVGQSIPLIMGRSPVQVRALVSESKGGDPNSDPTHCVSCGRRRWLKKPAKHPECYPCRGRVMRMTGRTKTPNRPRPKGDRWTDNRGYVRVRVGYGKQSWAYEHRVVMAATLGRPLLSSEDVHHINEDKQDNRPENLEVVSRSAHTAHHNSVSPKRKRLAPASIIALALSTRSAR